MTTTSARKHALPENFKLLHERNSLFVTGQTKELANPEEILENIQLHLLQMKPPLFMVIGTFAFAVLFALGFVATIIVALRGIIYLSTNGFDLSKILEISVALIAGLVSLHQSFVTFTAFVFQVKLLRNSKPTAIYKHLIETGIVTQGKIISVVPTEQKIRYMYISETGKEVEALYKSSSSATLQRDDTILVLSSLFTEIIL